jgi:DNA end-binding protein Ku
MAARAIGSGTISFGLVSIPIKLFTATAPKSVSFNMLHKTCGSRLNFDFAPPRGVEAIGAAGGRNREI